MPDMPAHTQLKFSHTNTWGLSACINYDNPTSHFWRYYRIILDNLGMAGTSWPHPTISGGLFGSLQELYFQIKNQIGFGTLYMPEHIHVK